MPYIKVTLTAEYWIEGPAEVIDIQGEQALKLSDRTLRPHVEFFHLASFDGRQSRWEPQTSESEEELWDGRVSEKLCVDVSDDAT
jgi:hypothetical protein